MSVYALGDGTEQYGHNGNQGGTERSEGPGFEGGLKHHNGRWIEDQSVVISNTARPRLTVSSSKRGKAVWHIASKVGARTEKSAFNAESLGDAERLAPTL